MTLNNILSCGVSFRWLTRETDGFSFPLGGAAPAYSGSRTPGWEPIPVLGSATVCIPTPERGNEAALGTGRSLGTASPGLVGETGGLSLPGGGKPSPTGFTRHTFSGSHAPAWEPIPGLGSAAVCISMQEALSNGRSLDAASPGLVGKTGGLSLPGGGKPFNARFFP